MKKLLMLAAACFVTAATVNAQSVKVGVKGGANLSGVTHTSFTGGGTTIINDEPSKTYDIKPGFQVGVFAEIGLGEHLAIQPEVMYTQKGYSGTVTAANINPDARYVVTYSYVDVPVLLKLKTGVGLNFLVGPSASFFLDSHHKLSKRDNDIDSSFDPAGEIKKEAFSFRKMDLGGVAGLSYDFTKNISLTATYSAGFQRFSHEDVDNAGLTTKQLNNTLAVSLGLAF